MNEARQRNLKIDELVIINEPWCGSEILRRLYDDPNLVVDTRGYWTDEEYDDAKDFAYDDGKEDGLKTGKEAIELLEEIMDHIGTGSKSIDHFDERIRRLLVNAE